MCLYQSLKLFLKCQAERRESAQDMKSSRYCLCSIDHMELQGFEHVDLQELDHTSQASQLMMIQRPCSQALGLFAPTQVML